MRKPTDAKYIYTLLIRNRQSNTKNVKETFLFNNISCFDITNPMFQPIKLFPKVIFNFLINCSNGGLKSQLWVRFKTAVITEIIYFSVFKNSKLIIHLAVTVVRTTLGVPFNGPKTTLRYWYAIAKSNPNANLCATVNALYIKHPEEGIERLKWRAV